MKPIRFFCLLQFCFCFAQSLHAQWDSLVVPGQDAITRTFISGGKLFTVSYTYGLYRSDDDGKSWIKQATPGVFGPLGGGFRASWQSVSQGDQIYLENYDAASDIFYLFQSKDAGNTWNEIPGADSIMRRRQYWVACDYGIVLFLKNTMCRRAHNGNTWEMIPTPRPDCATLASQGNEIWFGTGVYNEGVFRSPDAGQSWTPVNSITSINSMLIRGDTAFVANESGIYKSFDHGQNWQLIEAGFFKFLYSKFFAGANGFYLLKHTENAFPSDSVWYSADGFNTRQLRFRGDDPHLGVTDVFSINDITLIGTADMLFRSSASENTWKVAAYGIPSFGKYTSSLTVNQDSILLVRPNINNNNTLISIDLGKNWTVSRQVSAITSVAKKGSWYYVLTGYDILRTQGDFDRMEQVNHGPYAGLYKIDVLDTVLMTFTPGANLPPYIWYSRDNGLNWEHALQQPQNFRGLVFANKRFYSYDPTKHEAFYSTDFGNTWISLGRLGVYPGFYLTAADEVDGVLYLATYRGYYISADGGQSWEEHLLPNGFQFKGATQAGIFFQLESRLIYSPDNGASLPDVTPPGISLNYPNVQVVGKAGNTVLLSDASNRIWLRHDFESGVSKASGIVYKDENDNGIFDANEAPFPGVVVALEQAKSATSADINGRFTLFFNQNDQVSAAKPTAFCSSEPTNYPVSVSDSLLNFGIYCSAQQTDLGLHLIPFGPFRRGFHTLVALVLDNHGTTTQSGTLNLKYNTDVLQFTGATPAPANTQTGAAQWSFSNLKPYETRNFVIDLYAKPNSVLGDPVLLDAFTNPIPDDADTTDNRVKLIVSIVGSFDPNEKSVVPKDYNTDQLAVGTPLQYTVRFQNTGTYSADFVVIRDTLDAGLDLRSLQVIGASHPFKWSLQAPNVLEFRFDGINLPDSNANELESHGFVQFQLKPRADFQLFDTISNRVGIYFDFNEPVITNTVHTILLPTAAAHESTQGVAELLVWPNPASGMLHVQAPERFDPVGAHVYVYNALGQQMADMQTADKEFTIDVGKWPSGVYQVVWKNKYNQLNSRFLVH